jgi:carboxyl-terminal processing protease
MSMMQFSHRLSAILFASAIATTTTVGSISPATAQRSNSTNSTSAANAKTVVNEVWQIVNDRFVDGNYNKVDWNATRQSLLNRNYTSKEQAYAAIRDALKQLNDPYTRFMTPQQLQALTQQTITGELSGVGIRLQQDEKTKELFVVNAIEKSPALKAGIRAGDRIIAINGKSTVGMDVEAASNQIRGRAGTPVTLKLRRQGQTDFDLRITRAKIALPYVTANLKQEGNRRVGYIRLQEFSATAPAQMRQAIQSLSSQNVDGFVLDLRGNPGGLLLSGVAIARQWLDRGLIVREVERVGGSTTFNADGTALTRKPLVVLVDGDSASASEIVAGALKDNRRATIVGSTTFGKALVQQVFSLSDGSGLSLTVGRYITPSGSDINRRGIIPNVVINLNDSQKRQLATDTKLLGTRSDPQYVRAIAVLSNGVPTASSR